MADEAAIRDMILATLAEVNEEREEPFDLDPGPAFGPVPGQRLVEMLGA